MYIYQILLLTYFFNSVHFSVFNIFGFVCMCVSPIFVTLLSLYICLYVHVYDCVSRIVLKHRHEVYKDIGSSVYVCVEDCGVVDGDLCRKIV